MATEDMRKTAAQSPQDDEFDAGRALARFVMAARGGDDDASSSPTRARIVEVAIRLFAQRGYAGTSMRDIASQSKIKAASIYEYFNGKDELLREALLSVLARFHNHILEGMEVDATPEAQLYHMVCRHVSWQVRFAGIAEAWDIVADSQRISQVLSPEQSTPIQQRRKYYHELLTSLVAKTSPGPAVRVRAEAVLSICDRVTHWGADSLDNESLLYEQAWSLVRAIIFADVPAEQPAVGGFQYGSRPPAEGIERSTTPRI